MINLYAYASPALDTIKYKGLATHYDFTGLQYRYNILIGGPIKDLAGNAVTGNLLDVPEMYVVPKSVTSWYEGNKKSSIGNDDPITQFMSLLGGVTANISTLRPTVVNNSGNKFIQFDNTKKIELSAFPGRLYYFVYKNENLTSVPQSVLKIGNMLLRESIGNTSFEPCSTTCTFYNGTSFSTSTPISVSSFKFFAVDVGSNASRQIFLNDQELFQGELAFMMVLDGTYSNSDFIAIESYLEAQYAVNGAQW